MYRREPAGVIPNGIPLWEYRQDAERRPQWRHQEHIPSDATVVVCVASLRPAKNHPMLLKAFARIAHKRDVYLLVAGGEHPASREHAQAVKRLASDLGITDRVRFLGTRTDVPAILNASDIFVLASHYEGNPLSVMEAMAAGLPPVCTAVGGVPELIQHERTGLLVPPEDEVALAEALDRLIADAPLRRQLGAAAREYACAHFDVKTMVRAYEQFYLERLGALSSTSV
ncbi:MAG: glycosyltransferase [Fimbriimonadales bacterium]|nr:glycosyltransferase [Fimbriimonadales bacterium]